MDGRTPYLLAGSITFFLNSQSFLNISVAHFFDMRLTSLNLNDKRDLLILVGGDLRLNLSIMSIRKVAYSHSYHIHLLISWKKKTIHNNDSEDFQ
jgi:hypothetical protein